MVLVVLKMQKMYTDDTILPYGKFAFTALSRIPAAYLLNIYATKNKTDKYLFEYVENNLQRIKDRKEGIIKPPQLHFPCDKKVYLSKKEANIAIAFISEVSKRDKVPVRSYLCDKCGQWHLTSKEGY